MWRVSSTSGWLQTHYIAEVALEFLILQLPPFKCWDNRCKPPESEKWDKAEPWLDVQMSVHALWFPEEKKARQIWRFWKAGSHPGKDFQHNWWWTLNVSQRLTCQSLQSAGIRGARYPPYSKFSLSRRPDSKKQQWITRNTAGLFYEDDSFAFTNDFHFEMGCDCGFAMLSAGINSTIRAILEVDLQSLTSDTRRGLTTQLLPAVASQGLTPRTRLSYLSRKLGLTIGKHQVDSMTWE